MAGDEGGWLYGGRVAVHDLTARAGEWVRCATYTYRPHGSLEVQFFLRAWRKLVVASGGRVRADVVHRRIVAMGFAGGERTTRRAVAQVEEAFRAGRRRVFRPWIPEPGLWIGSRSGFKCTGHHRWRDR
jgi:hypothetical protein